MGNRLLSLGLAAMGAFSSSANSQSPEDIARGLEAVKEKFPAIVAQQNPSAITAMDALILAAKDGVTDDEAKLMQEQLGRICAQPKNSQELRDAAKTVIAMLPKSDNSNDRKGDKSDTNKDTIEGLQVPNDIKDQLRSLLTDYEIIPLGASKMNQESGILVYEPWIGGSTLRIIFIPSNTEESQLDGKHGRSKIVVFDPAKQITVGELEKSNKSRKGIQVWDTRTTKSGLIGVQGKSGQLPPGTLIVAKKVVFEKKK